MAIIIVLMVLILATNTVFLIMYTMRNQKSDINTIDYFNYDFTAVDKTIDLYIDDAGTKYKIENFGYLDPEELYLNEDKMNDMIRFMVKEVSKRLTPAFVSVLQLSYTINDDKDVVSFLYEKIKLYVLNYSLETNRDIE